MKKLTRLLTVTMVALLMMTVAVKAQKINVMINGVTQNYDTPPVTIDGRTLAPVRAIFEELGATVRWDEATKTVFAYKENKVITIPIDSKMATIQDENSQKEIELDVPAQLVNSSTYVPVRFVGEALGADVSWDGKSNTVVINYDIQREYERIDYTDGSYYEGDVVDGALDGYGVLYYSSGSMYEGYWKNDTMNGEGTYTWSDGSYYIGTWKDGDFLVGVMTNADGTTVNYDYSSFDDYTNEITDTTDLSNYQLAETYIDMLKPLVEHMTNYGITIPQESEVVMKEYAEGFFGSNRKELEAIAIDAPQGQLAKNITNYTGTIINEKHRVTTDDITEIVLEDGVIVTVAIVHYGDYIDELTSYVLEETVYVDRFNYMIFFVGQNDVVQGSEVAFTGVPIGVTTVEVGYETQPIYVVIAGDFYNRNYLEELFTEQEGDGKISDETQKLLDQVEEKMNRDYKIQD
ncbi:stalk domain-containing protein [Vallitalea okinawensis]|uniref:stalk domain-containing protein n=1 Tax=Vallitalea okinawensis TaxID=2078660 RepID=UPI0014788F2F|nr:stalk domain-containing protein [Vallitalea okinawensis]